ncbi:MAG: GntR family transcriptional regulator [Candidatus Atribacteria bacterium]|nr:GntR family transcriptional regulator [Candidatus Atribacteria bacterium]
MYKIEYLDLNEKVYLALKEMILKSELKSGDKLKQEKLARQLGVSRTPLQSAFYRLEKEFLVEIKPRKGAFVKHLSLQEFQELYDIRCRLESLGAYEAAKRATRSEITQLEKHLNIFQEKVERGDSPGILEADYNYHMAIMKMSKNVLLFRMISSFNILVISNMEGLLKPAIRSLEEHRELFQSIKNNQAELAEKQMYLHIFDAKERIQEKIVN